MTTSFDIEALRAVLVGVEQGSFARAAVELGRSQSAVSMQLKKLEQQAGTQLFVRKGRGLIPTEAGDALTEYARRIIALNDEAARAVGAAVTPETVRLGLPQDFYDDVMRRQSMRFRTSIRMFRSPCERETTTRSMTMWKQGVSTGRLLSFQKVPVPRESCSASFRCAGAPAKGIRSRSRVRWCHWCCSITHVCFDSWLWRLSTGPDGAGALC